MALSHTFRRTEVTSCQNNSLLQQELVCSVRQRLNFNFGTYRSIFHIDPPLLFVCVCVRACVWFGPAYLYPSPESESVCEDKNSEDSLDTAHHTSLCSAPGRKLPSLTNLLQSSSAPVKISPLCMKDTLFKIMTSHLNISLSSAARGSCMQMCGAGKGFPIQTHL